MANDNHHLAADAVMVSVTLLASVGWVFSLQALHGLPPLLFIGVRFLMAGMVLGGIGHRAMRALDRHDLRRGVATGLVMGVAMVCWILGLHSASNVGVGAFISSLGLIFAPIVGWALFKLRITASTWLATAVATVGMGCLSLASGLRLNVSDLYFLAAACALALHFNLNARYVSRIPVVALTAVQLTMVGLLSLAAATGLESWPLTISGETFGWLMASTLVATSLRFFLQVKGQSMASVSHAALIMTLEPVWTALIAMVWLGERMHGVQVLGCGLILLALLISRWRWIFGRVVVTA